MGFQTIPVGTKVMVVGRDPDDEGWIANMDATIGHTFVVIEENNDGDPNYVLLNTEQFKNERYRYMDDFWYHINDLEIIDDKCDFNTDELFSMSDLF